MFNPFLAGYFNVNYLGFLFLSFLKKKEAWTSTVLTRPRNAHSAYSTWGVKYPHGWWAHSARASQEKAPSCSFFITANLVKPTPTQVWYNVDSTPYPVWKKKMSLAKSNKPLSADVKQENKIAQWAINHFSLYKLTDTISICESGS